MGPLSAHFEAQITSWFVYLTRLALCLVTQKGELTSANGVQSSGCANIRPTISFLNRHPTFLRSGNGYSGQKGRHALVPQHERSADRSGRHKSDKLSLESLGEWFRPCQAVFLSSGSLLFPAVPVRSSVLHRQREWPQAQLFV